MRNLFIILFLICGLTASAANYYYVKNGGNDGYTGLSDAQAWATIDKVNLVWAAGTFAPGDGILFKNGDTFYGKIVISESGTSGNPITIGAYGTGNNPIITGFTDITSGWTNEGGNIYSKVITSDEQTNIVLVDGVQVPMGRWPNTYYRSFNTCTASVLTDNELSEETPYNWTGAEVVIRHVYWAFGRYHIINQTGDVITYFGGSISYSYNGFGYFIQNSLNCLDTVNEWYHNTGTGKFYIYGNPSGKTIRVGTKLNGVQNSNGYDYITIDGLTFTGSISDEIAFVSGGLPTTSYSIIQNNNIQYAGGKGMAIAGTGNLITYNIIDRTNGSAIYQISTVNPIVTHNTISNIGLIPGSIYGPVQGDDNSNSSGICIGGSGETIEYNKIYNVGLSGITGGSGTSATIRYNFVDTYCVTLNDGGGLYHGHNASPSVYTVTNNIFINGYGNYDGTTSSGPFLAEGIYLDSWAAGQIVQNNICANNSGTGIKIGSGNTNTIQNNLAYNNDETQLYVLGSWAYPTIFDNIIDHNQFISKSGTSPVMAVYITASDNIADYGTSNYNYYARPINQGTDNLTIKTYQTGSGYVDRNLAGWRTYSSQDANSNTSLAGAVSSEDDIHFIYNETEIAKVYSLSATMHDVANTSYSGTVTLDPWEGLVLLGIGTVTLQTVISEGTEWGKDKNGNLLVDKNGRMMIIR